MTISRRSTLILLGIAFLLGLGTMFVLPRAWVFTPQQALDAGREPGVRWACAMMDYIAETRGNGICPVCGMKLERISAGALNEEQRRRMGVETATVVEGHAKVTIRAYGAARYDQRTRQSVIPRVSGRIVTRHAAALHPGIIIEAGAPLVDLYSPQALASQAELVAARSIGDQPLIAAIEQRLRRWNLADVAEAISAGGAPTDTVTIRSPFGGRVVVAGGSEDDAAMLPEVGSEIMADRPLLDVVSPDAFMVVIHVPEQQARFLRLGQQVAIMTDDAGDLPDVDARIDWLAPDLSLETRTREVHLHLRDPKNRIFAGSLISARIEAALAPDMTPADPTDESTWGRFVLVPKSAVLSTGVRHVAWKLGDAMNGDQQFTLAGLRLGPRIEDVDGSDRYIVRSGLVAGDVVATQGAFLIDSQAQLVGSASLLFPEGAPTAAPAHQH